MIIYKDWPRITYFNKKWLNASYCIRELKEHNYIVIRYIYKDRMFSNPYMIRKWINYKYELYNNDFYWWSKIAFECFWYDLPNHDAIAEIIYKKYPNAKREKNVNSYNLLI